MRKMQIVAFALIMMISCVAGAAGAWTVYYIDGIKKDDGMMAMIDIDAKFIIMSSDSFVLDDCGTLPPSVGCISSKYFTFHHDPLVVLEVGRRWTYKSFGFSVIRRCVFKSTSGTVNGFDIASEQFYGRLNFYVSSSLDLLGWRLSHDKGEDLYLREGVKLGSCDRPGGS